MTETPTLTGQDIAEAQGAVRTLLDRILDRAGSTSNEYIALRVLAARGPWESPDALCGFLAGQPQLGLDLPAASTLVKGLEARGLLAAGSSGPIQLTASGKARHASLAQAVAAVTGQLYDGLNPSDLATAHQVLVQVTERADHMSGDL